MSQKLQEALEFVTFTEEILKKSFFAAVIITLLF